MIEVLSNNDDYATQRNFTDYPPDGYRYRKTPDWYKILNFGYLRLTGKDKYRWRNSHLAFPWTNARLFHFFNTVSFGRSPWITTFETTVPRWGSIASSLKGVEVLAGAPCKQLIALSQCAADMQRPFVWHADPDVGRVIEKKLLVKLPPQKALIGDYSEKNPGHGLRFSLIGGAFFLKGGGEILGVFDELWNQGADFHLNIVSPIGFGDHATKSNRSDQHNALQILEKHKANITHHLRLPNHKVLDLLKHSHVGLFPSWADTFGYSVLEAQAAGCPVITTDIRALPEINNDQVGWVIQVPKDEWGNGLLATPAQRDTFSEKIKTGLRTILTNIANNRGQIEEKGTRALRHIRQNHDPIQHAAFLKEVYDRALEL